MAVCLPSDSEVPDSIPGLDNYSTFDPSVFSFYFGRTLLVCVGLFSTDVVPSPKSQSHVAPRIVANDDVESWNRMVSFKAVMV